MREGVIAEFYDTCTCTCILLGLGLPEQEAGLIIFMYFYKEYMTSSTVNLSLTLVVVVSLAHRPLFQIVQNSESRCIVLATYTRHKGSLAISIPATQL